MSKTTLNRRDDTFCKLVAQEREAPGFSYAKSRNREYKGFNDDNAARTLMKSEAIQEAVNVYKSHIIMRDVAGRLEVLADLTNRLRAPTAPEIIFQLKELANLRLEPEVYKRRVAELNFAGIKTLKETKYGWQAEGFDKVNLAAKIMALSGVDISKPISDEGKRVIRATLTEIYKDMGGDDGGG